MTDAALIIGSADLRKLAAKLKGLGKAVKSRLTPVLGEATVSMVQSTFDAGADPYGEPWAPLQSREGHILVDTGRLRAAWDYRASSDGFEVFSGTYYATYHQEGTRSKSGGQHIPARPMLPTDERGLPQAWSRAYEKTVEKLIAKELK